MFSKFKVAINWAVITSFLTKKWVRYTTVDKIALSPVRVMSKRDDEFSVKWVGSVIVWLSF